MSTDPLKALIEAAARFCDSFALSDMAHIDDAQEVGLMDLRDALADIPADHVLVPVALVQEAAGQLGAVEYLPHRTLAARLRACCPEENK